MNDRLTEFASVQLEAIDEVLGVVARDRRRVEALLFEAESPSLRRYLQEWMDATAPSRPNDNLSRNLNHSELEPNAEIETRQLGDELRSDGHNNSSSSCCWSDPSKSFWEIVPTQSYRKFIHDNNFKVALQQHNWERSRLAYGVSYDWLMRPTFSQTDDDDGATSRWEWEDMDHFFKGRDCKILNQNINNVQEIFAEQQSASEFELYRKVLVPYMDHQYEQPSAEGSPADGNFLMNEFFGGSDNQFGYFEDCLPSVNQVLKAGGSITYDIIFYAASIFEPLLYHHRTAKGTLILNVSTQKANNDEGDESELDSTSSTHLLEGTVELDPSMKCVDAVPYAGNFSWKETSRMERIISERTGSDWKYSSTSVMLVNVTSVPSAPPRNIGRKAIGEVRVVRQRVALMMDRPSDEGGQSDYTNPGDVAALNQTASQRMDAYNSKRCLWMHRHTTLPKDVIERVGDFVCPPPAFYLEEGDLVVDIDWSDFVRPRDGFDLQGGVDDYALESLMSNSSIVARPRT